MHQYHWLADLHAAHYATLLRLAQNRLRHLTGNMDEAEDVVQDAFLLAAEKDIRHLENPLAWLMKTTSNLCMQRMDRAKRDAGKAQRFIQRKLDNSADRSAYAVERQESETDVLLWLLVLEQNLFIRRMGAHAQILPGGRPHRFAGCRVRHVSQPAEGQNTSDQKET